MKRILLYGVISVLALVAAPVLADLPTRQEAINYCYEQYNAARYQATKLPRNNQIKAFSTAGKKLTACLSAIGKAHRNATGEIDAAEEEYRRRITEAEKRARAKLWAPGRQTDEQVREAQQEAEKVRSGEREEAERQRRKANESAEREYEKQREKQINPDTDYYNVDITCDNLGDARQDIISKHNQIINAVRGNPKAVAAENARYAQEKQRLERMARECERRRLARCDQDFEARFREIQREANSPDANAETILEKLDKLKADKIACGLWLGPIPETPPTPPTTHPDDDVVASTPLKNIKSVSGSSNLARLIQRYVKTQNKHNKELEAEIAAAMKLAGDKRIIALEKAIGLNHQVLSQSVNDTIKKFQESRNVKPTPQRIIAQQPKTSTSTSKRVMGECESEIAGLTKAYSAYIKKETDILLSAVENSWKKAADKCPKATAEQPVQNCPAAEAPSTNCSNEKTASLNHYREGLGKALLNYTDVLKKSNIDSLTQLVNILNAQELQTSIRDVLLQAINAELSRSETVASNAEDTLTAEEKIVYDAALNAPQSPTNSGSSNED